MSVYFLRGARGGEVFFSRGISLGRMELLNCSGENYRSSENVRTNRQTFKQPAFCCIEMEK